jgi:hypothetical protein
VEAGIYNTVGSATKGIKCKGSEIHKARPLAKRRLSIDCSMSILQTFLTTQTSEGALQKKKKSTSEPVGCNFSMHNKVTLKSNKQTNKQNKKTHTDGGSGTQCSHSRHRLHWETGIHVASRSRSHRRLQEGTRGHARLSCGAGAGSKCPGRPSVGANDPRATACGCLAASFADNTGAPHASVPVND